MTKELRDLFEKLETKKAEGRTLLNEGKLDEAEALMVEIRDIQRQIELHKNLENESEITGLEIEIMRDEKLDIRSVFRKVLSGQILNTEERALVAGTGADGGYLVPQEISTQINEIKRQYKSMKELVGVQKTNTKSGSIVFEDLSGISDLADLTEVNAITEQQPKFKSVSYSIKDYGALLPISNTLIQDEDADLFGYIGRWFAKKAIRTENKKIFETMKTGKTSKTIADWKALKSVINKELDPLVSANAVIVTNQDGFDYLDNALDNHGRPVLQPNPINPTEMRFMGRPVHVFSNAELPSTGTTNKKAPIFIGALEEGIRFIDRGVYEMKASSEFGFDKNVTYVRCIERFDVVQADADAYIYGELTINE